MFRFHSFILFLTFLFLNSATSSNAISYPTLISLTTINGTNGYRFLGQWPFTYGFGTAGDLNHDGFEDILIGSENELGRFGSAYIVFGGKNLSPGQTPNNISISSLAASGGQLGFRLDTDPAPNISPPPSFPLGDVNGDNIDDIVIGAWGYEGGTGICYVVFGSPTIGIDQNGVFDLKTLNGTNGFRLEAENLGDYLGGTGEVGDFNGDGFNDIMITAWYANYSGRTYVVYGGPSVGRSGTFPLSSLNGTNGFKINTEINPADPENRNLMVIRPAYDVNGDKLDDLIIGVPSYDHYTGRSYVIYGTKDIRSYQLDEDGAISLGDLNGTNGIKFMGVVPAAQLGWDLNGVNDINLDGYDDVAMGAPQTPDNKGIVYIFFGGPDLVSQGINNNGQIRVDSVNGTNGFLLTGHTNSQLGSQIRPAGDVDQDSIPDLIMSGFPMGRTYILLSGKLLIGQANISLPDFIDGTNGFMLDGVGIAGAFLGSIHNLYGDGTSSPLIAVPDEGMGTAYVIYPKYLQQ